MNDTCKNDNNKCNLSCKEKIDKLIKPLFILIGIYFLSKFFIDDLSRKEMINYGSSVAFISIILIIAYCLYRKNKIYI